MSTRFLRWLWGNSRPDPGAAHDGVRDLSALLRTRYGLVTIETRDEERVARVLHYLAASLEAPLFFWSPTRGLVRSGEATGIYNTRSPDQAFAHVAASPLPAIYHFPSVFPALEDEVVAVRARDACDRLALAPGALVLSGSPVSLPRLLRSHAASYDLPAPTAEEYRQLLERLLRDLGARRKLRVMISEEERNQLLANLNGLTMNEAEKVLTKAIVVDGALTAADIRHVIAAKKQILEDEGLLEYHPVEDNLTDVAGVEGLRHWLGKRRRLITEPERAKEYGLPFPRGILLVGVPGTGKSLCAKTVAREWGLPLLKMDPASLYNKYIGETESNFRRAMKTAEAMAPVVLWIDEIEKALSQGGEDGGASARVLGTFLSWLQDRKGDVFVAATANDVTRLPPELMRKGRFDEIFFVDLPGVEVREELFRIHLTRHNQSVSAGDRSALARASEGFSGAEIEQVVIAALYSAFASDVSVTADLVLDEIKATRPLSVTMAERISGLRAWAAGRTVSAS